MNQTKPIKTCRCKLSIGISILLLQFIHIPYRQHYWRTGLLSIDICILHSMFKCMKTEIKSVIYMDFDLYCRSDGQAFFNRDDLRCGFISPSAFPFDFYNVQYFLNWYFWCIFRDITFILGILNSMLQVSFFSKWKSSIIHFQIYFYN